MLITVSVIAALALGFFAGWYGRTLRRFGARTPRRTTPFDHDEYLQRLDRLDRAYTDSIKEYDRLVTWISSGALAVSVTFAERLGPEVRQGTAWLLAAGWSLLSAALLSSLWSQYFSSRVHSSRQRELNHLQTKPEERPPEWADEAGRLNLVSGVWGKLTKYLTFGSGVLLAGGFVALASYAFVNLTTAPAREPPAAQGGDSPIRVPDIPVKEKKGLEDLVEPLPRPIPPPQPTPTGQEQK